MNPQKKFIYNHCRIILPFLVLKMGVVTVFSTLSAMERPDIPPYHWGDPGVRECMIETADRWHGRFDQTPLPSEDISTHGPRVPAFPGAEGFGAYSFGGRGGTLYRVTNLNDRGSGSLREAAEAEGPRIIIFDVSGTIELETPINVYNPYVTFAGQTAPGDGITVSGRRFSIRTYDVILRHMRFRHGNDGVYRVEEGGPGEWVLGARGNHIIFDHVTVTWGVDGNVLIHNPADNVTMQNSVLAKPLWDSVHFKGVRGYGALVRGQRGARYSILRNVWANNRARVPRPGNYVSHTEDPDGLLMDFRNNIIYMGIGTNFDVDTITEYNYINNYFLTDWRLIDRSTHTQAYLSGNYHVNPERLRDQWMMIDAGENVDRNYHEQSEPFDAGTVTTLSAEEAWDHVLATAGTWIRDDHDRYVINEIRNYRLREIEGREETYPLPYWWKTGGIDHQNEVGGLPHLESVTMPEWIDSNRNGIPDWWEKSRGLDTSNPDIANIDSNGNGYTNIEDYINDPEAIAITRRMAGFSSR